MSVFAILFIVACCVYSMYTLLLLPMVNGFVLGVHVSLFVTLVSSPLFLRSFLPIPESSSNWTDQSLMVLHVKVHSKIQIMPCITL
jgi:hypothetical protein